MVGIKDIIIDNKVEIETQRNSRYYRLVEPELTGLMPSVTTILGVVNKPGLNKWRENIGFDNMASELLIWLKERSLSVTDIPELVQKARAEPDNIADDAAGVGLWVHAAIERWIKDYQASSKGMEVMIQEAAEYQLETGDARPMSCLLGFVAWWESEDTEIVGTEIPLVSEENRYGGTIDLLTYKPGYNQFMIIDFKTSNDVYPEYVMQLAAYKSLVKDWVTDKYANSVVMGTIVQLYKTPKVKRKELFKTHVYGSIQLDEALAGFLGARQLFKYLRGR